MDNEFRRDLNVQTLEIISQLLEQREGVIIACMIRDKDGKQHNIFGYEIGPDQFIPILKEAAEGLIDGFKKMKDDTPKN